MAEEIKKILTIETGRSFDSIRDLRTEIRELNRVVETGTKLIQDENGEMQEVRVTASEYDKAVKNLAEDKRTLAEVTRLNNNAWDAEADAVDRSQKSYAQLQAEMRRLRVAWRNTANDADRKAIAAEINDINDRLKEMDAETGNYQRNVGDYFNAIQKGLAGIPGPLGNVASSAKTATTAIKNIAGKPVLAALGALSVVLVGLIKVFRDLDGRVEDNERLQRKYAEATESARAIVDAYTAKLDAMGEKYVQQKSALEELKTTVEVFAKSFVLNMDEASKVGRWIPILGLFKQIKAAVIDVKDAVTGADGFKEVESEITKTQNAYTDAYRKSVVEQARLNKERAEAQRIAADADRDAGERLAAVNVAIEKTRALENERLKLQRAKIAALQAEAARSENSTEANTKLAEAEAELINIEAEADQSLKRLVSQRASLNKEIQKTIDGFNDLAGIEAEDAAMQETAAQLFDEVSAGRVAAEDAMTKAIVEDAQQRIAAGELEAWKQKKQLEDEKKRVETRKAIYSSYGQAVAGVLDSIADIMESSTEGDEKNTRAAKALRIASATIDTLQGAITAYSAAQSLGPVAGPIVGGANAAAVTAMGLANIAKIRATNVSKSGSSAPSLSAAVVSAPPAVVQEVPVMRTLTGAAEEQRLNEAPAAKVVLVMSELEAKQGDINAKKVETTF